MKTLFFLSHLSTIHSAVIVQLFIIVKKKAHLGHQLSTGSCNKNIYQLIMNYLAFAGLTPVVRSGQVGSRAFTERK